LNRFLISFYGESEVNQACGCSGAVDLLAQG